MNRVLSGIAILSMVLVSACANTAGKTPVEKRQAIVDMRNQVLSDLYKVKPDVKAQIISAEGYAVFSNANINLCLQASARSRCGSR